MKLKSMTSLITKSALVLAACASLSAFAGTAPSGKAPVAPMPEEDPALFDTIGAELAVGFDTRYYRRGLYFADNTIWAGLNLSLPLTEQLSLGLGAKYIQTVQTETNGSALLGGLPNSSRDFDYSELDLSASLNYDAGFALFSVIYTNYQYFDSYSGSVRGFNAFGNDPEFGITSANEIGVSVAKSFFGLNTSFGWFYDFTIGGSYFQFAADYPVEVTPWLSLVPGAQLGYGIDYYTGSGAAAGPFGPPVTGTQTSGFTHLLLSLSAPVKLTKSATLTPYVAWNVAFQTRNYLNSTHDNELFGGVKLGVSF